MAPKAPAPAPARAPSPLVKKSSSLFDDGVPKPPKPTSLPTPKKASGGLFDDEDSTNVQSGKSTKSSLFGDPLAPPLPTTKAATPQSKKPSSSSLFGDDEDLFSPPKPKAQIPKPAPSTTTTATAAPARTGSFKSSSLFDDPGDDDPLFGSGSSSAKKAAPAPAPKTPGSTGGGAATKKIFGGGLFDDDEDIFGSSTGGSKTPTPALIPPKVEQEAPKPTPPAPAPAPAPPPVIKPEVKCLLDKTGWFTIRHSLSDACSTCWAV